MFEGILKFFKGLRKTENNTSNSGDKAKERLHLVLMQDRANVSADFLELMKQEIIDVIKKYIEVDESAIDVRLTKGEDGETGAPALYANIPILNIRNDMKKLDPATGKAEPEKKDESVEQKQEENKPAENVEEKKEDVQEEQKQNDAQNEQKQEEVKQEEIKQEENVEEKKEDVQEEQKQEENNKNEVNNE